MKIRDPNLNSETLKKDREGIALPPLETITVNSSKNPFLFWFVWTATLIIIALIGYFVGRFIGENGNESVDAARAFAERVM